MDEQCKFTKVELLKLLKYVSDEAIIKINFRGEEFVVWGGGFNEGEPDRPESIKLFI